MKTKTILGATLLMLVASTMPVNAYHIGSSLGSTGLANSFSAAVPFLIVCESDGPADPRNPGPEHGGQGGLCTSGRNAITCGVACVPIPPPPVGTWTRFDMLDSTGSASTIGYDVEIGVTFCNVLPIQEVRYQELYAWWSFDAPDQDSRVKRSAKIGHEDGSGLSGNAGYHGHVAAWFDATTSTDTSGFGYAAASAAPGVMGCGTSPALNGPVQLV